MLNPATWTRDTLSRHAVDMRQFIALRESTLPNGSRIIDAHNSSGLTFTLLPDRGLDLWSAHYKGVPLTWVAHGAPYAPDFGAGWLQQFNGGLLTTCGLTHVGAPEVDAISGELRDIHGRFSRLRAQDVAIDAGAWQDESTYSAGVRGSIAETRLFGEQLVCERRYSLRLSEPVIRLTDTVRNVGDLPAPLMLLYHVNVGFPLVSAGTQLITPHRRVSARDADAQAGIDTWHTYDAAVPAYREQVFFHDLAAKDGWTQIVIGHTALALMLRWQTDTLPRFTQWKNTREGVYVCGVEPGNCIPEGQNAARENGRLVMLPPHESQQFTLELHILDGMHAVSDALATTAQILESRA